MVSGERMGKSMGNFVTIRELLQKHDAEALRLYYAMRHYRTQLEFDEAGIAQAEEVIDKLRSVYNQFSALLDPSRGEKETTDDDIDRIATQAMSAFTESMDDDFNTPRALAALISYAKDVEAFANLNLSKQSVELILRTFDYFGEVFGILQPVNRRQAKAFDELVDFVVRIREDARKGGDWQRADKIRDQLRKIGIGLEDTSTGARWYLASSKS